MLALFIYLIYSCAPFHQGFLFCSLSQGIMVTITIGGVRSLRTSLQNQGTTLGATFKLNRADAFFTLFSTERFLLRNH